MTSVNSRPHYLALDGLRGVAALSVVIYHRRWMLSSHDLFGHAWLAVDFFFILSGFVIAFAYEDRLRSGLSFLQFSWIRIQRLYPLIILGTLLGGAYYALALRHVPGATGNVMRSMPLALLGLPAPSAFNFLHDAEPPLFAIDPPIWSIFFEITANIAFALLARRMGFKGLLAVIAVTGVLECFVAFSGLAYAGVYARTFWLGFPRAAFPFFSGVLIYRLHRDGVLPRFPLGWGALSLALVAVFLAPAMGRWEAIYFLACVGLLFPLIVIAGASHQPTGRSLSWAAFGGAISYPIYAIHYPVFLWFEHVRSDLGIPLPGKISVPLEAAVALGVAYFLLKVYDEPVRAFLARWTRSRISTSAGGAATDVPRNSETP